MRTQLLFDDVDASVTQTSGFVDDIFNDGQLNQRGEFMIQVTRAGLDGTPRLFLEWSIDNNASVWSTIQNPETDEDYFELDDDIGIIDDRIMAKWFRLRLEPNDNTTGTVRADIGYNTYP